jgi:putative DNA primase/helicase
MSVPDVRLRERMRGRWSSLVPMLGLDRRYLTHKNMPCPWCGGRDRFRFIDREGYGNFVCNQCGKGDGITLAMRLTGLGYAQVAQKIEALLGDLKPEPERKRDRARELDAMRRLWGAGRPITLADPVGKYLASRRIAVPLGAHALRHHPSAVYSRRESFPAMLALVTAPGGKAINVHRTFLTERGEKAFIEKVRLMMPGETPLGSAIRLSGAGSILGVGEGIESTLSAAEVFNVPTWSLMSAQNLAAFVEPDEVEELLIAGDNDANFTGQAAAYTLARKAVVERKKRVRVIIPPGIGRDWNDLESRKAGQCSTCRGDGGR